MEEYFKGHKLYGDDFSLSQIKAWYEQEAEGYANLGSKNKAGYNYVYHQINAVHGFSKIDRERRFEHALGFGSAYGHEFEPVIDRIGRLTIIEPSDNLISFKLGEIIPEYVKPEIDGRLSFEDNSFDLITCFGTLHHIPNVSFVLGEILRVLKPNGILLLREPINSMGDWRSQRRGLTKNERGIPLNIFDNILNRKDLTIIGRTHCFTMTSFFQRFGGRFFPKPIFSYRSYVLFDKYLSKLLSWNLHYHSKYMVGKCAPSNIYFTVRKR